MQLPLSAMIRCIPEDDCRRAQIEPGCAVALILKGAVTDFAEAIEEHGAPEGVFGPSTCARRYGAEWNVLAQLSVTAQSVSKLHLMRCAAFRREEPGTADNNTSAVSARGCNVEAIEIVKELHASWRILR